MMVKYDHFGMKYGWLGKQAALCVEDIVDIKDYDKFYGYATDKQDNVDRLIEKKSKKANKKKTKKGGLLAIPTLKELIPNWWGHERFAEAKRG